MTKFAHRFREITTATSMAVIALGGAAVGGQTLAKVITKGAADPLAFKVGDTNIQITIEDSVGNWEEGLYTITSATVLTRTQLLDSSNDGAAVTNWSGTRTVFCTPSAQWLSTIMTTADGIATSALAAASSANGSTKLLGLDSNNGVITVAAGLLPGGTGGGSSDTTAPTMNGSLTSSNVSATAATLNWSAASDAVGVTGYEVSKDGGTTYTAIGNVLTYTYTGLTASTAYAMRVRAVDAAGNKATPLSLSVTTAAPSGDTTAPNLAGSLTTSNVTATGYTMNWPAATDNVAVTGYETSTDGGTTFADAGNVLTRNVTGAAASTLYNLRVRAYDAAGNRSNVLSATVTTSASSDPNALTAANWTVANPDPAYGESYTANLGGNPYWSTAMHVAVKQVADPTKYPADNALICFWTRVASGAAAPSTLPTAQQFSGGAWPGSVTNASNGGTTGTVPNSVKPLVTSGNAGYPDTFRPDSTVYGGPIAGDYYLVVGFPDGTWKLRPGKVVVTA